jgi:HAD superfamily hydrolase (TIGR01509 family)
MDWHADADDGTTDGGDEAPGRAGRESGDGDRPAGGLATDGGGDGDAPVRPAAVLFDMDGVLVDSERYWEAFEAEFYPEVVEGERPAREETTGMNYRDTYDYLEAEYGTTVTRAEFTARFETAAEGIYGDRVSLMDGAVDLVAAIRAAGLHVAVVSSSPSAWIDDVVERFDLGPFDDLVSAEDVEGPGKPAPGIYEHAAAELGVDPADCVVIEDSVNGIRAAVEAGTYVIGYRTPDNEGVDLSAADAVVDGPDGLRARLAGLSGVDLDSAPGVDG